MTCDTVRSSFDVFVRLHWQFSLKQHKNVMRFLMAVWIFDRSNHPIDLHSRKFRVNASACPVCNKVLAVSMKTNYV